MILTRNHFLAALLTCLALGIWFQANADQHRSPEGVALRRGTYLGATPPWGRKYFTLRGWRYRKIAFIFEALGFLALAGLIRSLGHG